MRLDGAAPTYGGKTGAPATKTRRGSMVGAAIAGVLVVVLGAAGVVWLTVAVNRPARTTAAVPTATVSASPSPGGVSATPLLALPADALAVARDFVSGYVAADPAVRTEKVTATATPALAQRVLTAEPRPTTVEGAPDGRQTSLGGTVTQRLGRGTATLTLTLDGTSPTGWRVSEIQES